MALKKKKIGEILIENNYLKKEQIQRALKEKQKRERLGHTLVRLGLITQEKIAEALSKQTNIPRLDFKEIDEDTVNILEEKYIFELNIIPIYKEDNYLILGITDPLDITIIDKAKKITGLEIIERIATNKEIEEIFRKYYHQEKDFNSLLEEMDIKIEKKTDLNNIEENSAPIINLVNKIISEGLKLKASDIHIEPMRKKTRIRYRIDGALHEKLELPKIIHEAVILRIKIMSGLDISDSLKTQDGKINLKFAGQNIDFRISTLPSTNGEKIVIRILDKGNIALNFTALGFGEKELGKIKKMMNVPYGMILATGPTGSGKTTTLYTILKKLNSNDKNIITIEDPVEYQIEGVTQVAVNKKLNFADGLKSIVRQDPDIIMIGEIRDKETAQIAIQASLTGHLVLSTLHTNTAIGAISRLINIGIEPFLVSSALLGVVSQRLIRLLCDCKVKVKNKDDIYISYQELLKSIQNNVNEINLFKEGKCQKCNNIGYKGRTSIQEILILTSKLRELIAKNKTIGEIKKIAEKEGLKTLEESAIEKVNLGLTSFNEIQKTTIL